MGRYRKMLVAVDGSDSSRNALRQAFSLADLEKSWMVVVSVSPRYEGDLALIGVRNLSDVLAGPYQKALDEAKEMAKAEGRFIRTACEQGEPYEKIVDLAEAENCDLILIGRKGTTKLERMLMGSVTARVIGHSRTDVLVIPEKTQIGWTKILAPTDGSKSSAKSMEKAIDLTKSYGGELEVLSVSPVSGEFYAEAPSLAEELTKKARICAENARLSAELQGVKATGTVIEGEPYEVITRLAKDHGADIIVMGSHGRSGVKRLLMGSVTEKVIGHSTSPVLVVK